MDRERQTIPHSPQGPLDRAGIRGISSAGQLVKALHVCEDQRRPPFPGQGQRQEAAVCRDRRPWALLPDGIYQPVWVPSSPPPSTQAGNGQNEGPGTFEGD